MALAWPSATPAPRPSQASRYVTVVVVVVLLLLLLLLLVVTVTKGGAADVVGPAKRDGEAGG